MKCISMKLSHKAMCNPCFFLLENRENVNCLSYNRSAFCVCTVYTILCFLHNPALKVNFESNCNCRGKCAISRAFTSGQLITCDYKHAVDCDGGARLQEGFVWNYGFANAKCLEPLAVTVRLLQDTNTNFVLLL